jgi:DNA-directed RNA polymerase alpha subunit
MDEKNFQQNIEQQQNLDIQLDNLDMSIKVQTILHAHGIDTLKDIVQKDRNFFLEINRPGLGEKGIEELDTILREHNLRYNK